MIEKNKIKLFNSLKLKKYRDKNQLFIAERYKVVFDLIDSGAKIKYLLVVEEFFNTQNIKINGEVIICIKEELKSITNLNTPPDVIGIFEFLDNAFDIKVLEDDISIFCDDIQNPGNLGTIIRTADWFGINNIICSRNSVDFYNYKVIQATAGSAARVKITYVEKEEFFSEISKLNIASYGTFLEGENIYVADLAKNGLIILGNEGQGISAEVEQYVNKKIYIPGYPKSNPNTESLNVAVAAAITFAEFRRRK